jgi:hypothetical protein
MFLRQRFLYGVSVLALAVVPASADLITWTFGDTGSTVDTVNPVAPGAGTNTVLLTATAGGPAVGITPPSPTTPAGSSLFSGSFTYNVDGGDQVNFPGLGAISNIFLNTTPSGGSVIANTSTWYAVEQPDYCCTQDSLLVFSNFDPTTHADMTNVDGNGTAAMAIGFSLDSSMFDVTGATSIPIDGIIGGYCDNAECGIVNSSIGYPIISGSSTAYIYAAAPVIIVGDTPEPSTFVLAGTVLLGFGLRGRKLLRSSRS